MFDRLVPVRSRLNIHLDNAGIGGDLDQIEAPIVWRLIALYVNRLAGELGLSSTAAVSAA